MQGADDTVSRILAAVAPLTHGDAWVLAVSGGADSMALLHAVAAARAVAPPRDGMIAVATFDHGTGIHAARAAALVRDFSASLGVPCVIGSTGGAGRTEAEWRAARWRFLRGAARTRGARIATAHTRDDQIETVFMRALRGAGARGLAALYARSDVARPLVGFTRAELRSYVHSNDVPFLDDPSNADRRHLRNRVRLDLLPALERARPGFGDDLLALARRAADWRARMEALALTFPLMTDSTGTYSFERAPLRGLDQPSLRTLWPALAARAGVVLDWRGTERLAAFTIDGATGQQIQVAGGVRVFMKRDAIAFRMEALRG
jgi:tRNA(Ile)-lysidine synthase